MTFNASIDIINILIPRTSKHPGFKGCINIGRRDFKSYLNYRFIKDSIGFIPTSDDTACCTDGLMTIQCVRPNTQEDFLIYAHELGHCKSKQYISKTSGYYRTLFVDRATIENEVNAWAWGLRYYRRLGFTFTEKALNLVKKSLGSYLRIAQDLEHAKLCCLRIQGVTGLSYRDYVPMQKEEIQDCVDKRKPWVILKEKQQKRQWRNQK